MQCFDYDFIPISENTVLGNFVKLKYLTYYTNNVLLYHFQSSTQNFV